MKISTVQNICNDMLHVSIINLLFHNYSVWNPIKFHSVHLYPSRSPWQQQTWSGTVKTTDGVTLCSPASLPHPILSKIRRPVCCFDSPEQRWQTHDRLPYGFLREQPQNLFFTVKYIYINILKDKPFSMFPFFTYKL